MPQNVKRNQLLSFISPPGIRTINFIENNTNTINAINRLSKPDLVNNSDRAKNDDNQSGKIFLKIQIGCKSVLIAPLRACALPHFLFFLTIAPQT